jgi:FAD/FMN-containing dehydrogenase
VTAESIAIALHGRKVGSSWMVPCPAHEDSNPSLGITERDGKLLVRCYAGCAQARVVEALKGRGLWPEREPSSSWREINTYSYTDETGSLLYQIVKSERYVNGERKKKFAQRYPAAPGGWVWKKHPRQVLYRLPEVLEAPIIICVEGERDAETLRSWGFCATTNAGGAGAPWLDSYTETLRGREIILIPDNDPPGRARVLRIARALLGRVARLVVLELEGGAKDVSEWFEQGHSETELIYLLDGDGVRQ